MPHCPRSRSNLSTLGDALLRFLLAALAFRRAVTFMGFKVSNVFVIDHDLASRESVVELVRVIGLEVDAFESAGAFLAQYDGSRPACVITELQMLDMSANDLLCQLRERGLSIPVVVLTAHANTSTTVQVMRNGAFATIDKPFHEPDLWEEIRKALHEDVQREQADRRRLEIRERFAHLDAAERKVLSGLLEGQSNKAIAFGVGSGLRTIEARRKSLFKKMEVASIAVLVKHVMLAQLENQLPPPPRSP